MCGDKVCVSLASSMFSTCNDVTLVSVLLDSTIQQRWRHFLDEDGIVIVVCFNLLHLKYFKI